MRAARRRRSPRSAARDRGRRAGRDRLGTAAIGDVGNTLDAVPAHRAAGLRGVFFHELLGSRATRSPATRSADAAREGDRRRPAAPGLAAGLAYAPAPHAPYSVGPDLMRRIFAAAARTGLPTSIHVAEDRDEIALLRDGTGRWPAVLEAMGVDPKTRVPGKSPVAYLAALGAFAAPAPPLLVHMVHADADDRRRAREAGATVVLCPRSNLHIGGRLPDVPALLADGVCRSRSAPTAWRRPPTCRRGARSRRWPRISPRSPPRPGSTPPPRGGAEALGLARYGALRPGKRPGRPRRADRRRGRRRWSRWCAIRAPHLRWVARA